MVSLTHPFLQILLTEFSRKFSLFRPILEIKLWKKSESYQCVEVYIYFLSVARNINDADKSIEISLECNPADVMDSLGPIWQGRI